MRTLRMGCRWMSRTPSRPICLLQAVQCIMAVSMLPTQGNITKDHTSEITHQEDYSRHITAKRLPSKLRSSSSRATASACNTGVYLTEFFWWSAIQYKKIFANNPICISETYQSYRSQPSQERLNQGDYFHRGDNTRDYYIRETIASTRRITIDVKSDYCRD